MVQHENELINHRLTWLAALQGFLFAALGLLIKDSVPIGLVIAVCIVGLGSSLSVAYSLYWSSRALDPLNHRAGQLGQQLDLDLGQPETWLDRFARRFSCLHPWRFLPLLFVVVWMSISIAFAVPQLRSWVMVDQPTQNGQATEPTDKPD